MPVKPVQGMLLLTLLMLIQPGCIWKLWTDDTPLEEKTFDVYGTVESITPSELVVQTRKGSETFVMTEASIKGGDFGAGAYVHVYYKIAGDQQEVTMVVEKVDR